MKKEERSQCRKSDMSWSHTPLPINYGPLHNCILGIINSCNLQFCKFKSILRVKTTINFKPLYAVISNWKTQQIQTRMGANWNCLLSPEERLGLKLTDTSSSEQRRPEDSITSFVTDERVTSLAKIHAWMPNEVSITRALWRSEKRWNVPYECRNTTPWEGRCPQLLKLAVHVKWLMPNGFHSNDRQY